MKAIFRPCRLSGKVNAPPSKSMAHRYLVGAALSKEKCVISGVDFSEDILATIDCLKAMGVEIQIADDTVTVNAEGFMKSVSDVMNCRESGSTLRFFIPLALCSGKKITLKGSPRLFERPLDVYEKLCADNGFEFRKNENSVTVCGNLKSGKYEINGDISSQFITGLIFALVYLGEEAEIRIIPPFESRSYINLTVSALKSFGADVVFADEYTIMIRSAKLHSFSGSVEGDYSNAAFLDAFNYIGSEVEIGNLNADSLQGDRICKEYFEAIAKGTPTLDISDCPDLGPILFAVAAAKSGGVFTGTKRLKIKESDRANAMAEELQKFGTAVTVHEDAVVVFPTAFHKPDTTLFGHNDHRIVMSLAVLLTLTGGEIDGAEAVRKSFPNFFEKLTNLGIEVNTV